MKLSKKVSVALLSLVMLTGVSAGASHPAVHASHVHHHVHLVLTNPAKHHRQQTIKKQQRAQNQPSLIHKVNKKSNNRKNNQKNNWFKDGLSHQNLAARNWVTYRESGHNWYVSNGRCVGYFQLSASYLGYKHGRLNMNPRHQVKVGDAYANSRYGSWVNAKQFWQAHHWY